MKLIRSLICMSALISAPLLYSGAPASQLDPNRQSLQTQMLTDIDFVKNMLDAYYAPTQWKQIHQGWNLEAEWNKARDQIKKSPNLTVKEYQRILKKFLSTTRDHHVQVKFESTEVASLPFTIKGTKGRYFVVDVDRDRLSNTVFPIQVGDEITKFDGKPVGKTIDELKALEFTPPFTKTDQAIAEMLLTFRSGKSGDIVPQGPIVVTVKHAAAGTERSYQLIWDYTPEKIKDISTKITPSKKSLAVKSLARAAVVERPDLTKSSFFRTMLSPTSDRLSGEGSRRHTNSHDLSSRESFIPALGQIVWKTEPTSNFHAYIFVTPSGKAVGYIRIPNYKGGAPESQEFTDIIGLMQSQTDALVIDQINNPGGSAFYLYSLIATLTDKPLYTPKHKVSLSQKDISFVVDYLPLFEMIQSDEDAQAVIGASFSGNPVTYQLAQFMINYFRFVLGEWEKGNTLTEPTYLYGVDFINPSPRVNFTKPILVLINEMDFSGGDFFPAILQDNKRATLLGTPTAGAGGSVDKMEYINLLGVNSIALTTTLAARADQNPIENLGVTPDITYELTADDMQYGYQGYVAAINKALDKLLEQTTK